jgi:hypothetical protein
LLIIFSLYNKASFKAFCNNPMLQHKGDNGLLTLLQSLPV